MVNAYLNYEWFLKEDLSGYSGKWIAIVDKHVVASGLDVKKVVKEAKEKYPQKKSLITKVKNKLAVL